MNSEQQMRAYAAQAAASYTAGLSGTMKDLLHAADTIYAWITRGFDGVPPDELMPPREEETTADPQAQETAPPADSGITSDPAAQKLAEEAFVAASRVDVEDIQQRGQRDGLLDKTVVLGQGFGALGEYLKFRWKELPREEQTTGVRADLGL